MTSRPRKPRKMARTPDKPGTYRVRPKGTGYILSGVKSDGQRVRVPVNSQWEGESLASTLFPKPAFSANNVPSMGPTSPASQTIPTVDEWGLPVVTQEQSNTVATAMGYKPDPGPGQSTADTDRKVAEERAKQEHRKKYAKSLMELGGHAYAMGVVMGSTRLITSSGKVPVKPSPKQVTDLAEVTRDTLSEMFGDVELKPWLMMCLLTIGIPLSMWIQSPRAPKRVQNESQEQGNGSPNLRSVT